MKSKKIISSMTAAVLMMCFFTSSAKGMEKEYVSTRISGSSRAGTAAEIARAYTDGKPTDTAILTTAYNYPDALAAAPLGALYNAPILLTDKDKLDLETSRILTELKVKKVFLLGGYGVVDKGVQKEVENKGIEVERISGANRYETAVKIADKIKNPSAVALVSGEDFADALSIAPIAAKKGIPILLIPSSDEIPKSVMEYMKKVSINRTYIIGEFPTIDKKIERSLAGAERIQGNTKYERNINIIDAFKSELEFENICISTGKDYPDALSGSLYAAKKNAPILLVEEDEVRSAKEFIEGKRCTNEIYFGGNGAVSKDLEEYLAGRKEIPLSEMEKEWSSINKEISRKIYNYGYIGYKDKIVRNKDIENKKEASIIYEDSIGFIDAKYNKKYTDLVESEILRYYSPYMVFENGKGAAEEVDEYVKERIKYTVSSSGKFITDPSLTYYVGDTIVQRGTLRIKYDIKTSEEYLNKNGIQSGIWYEKDIEILWKAAVKSENSPNISWNTSFRSIEKVKDLSNFRQSNYTE